MTILALAAAWKISQFNADQFSKEQMKRQMYRLNHRTCCMIGFGSYLQTLSDQSAGTINNHRKQLTDRFITLQRERNACSLALMQSQGDLPLYWGSIVAKARESRALRARHEELSRQINVLSSQDYLPQLTTSRDAAVSESDSIVRADRSAFCRPFLENLITRRLTSHPQEFEISSYEASLEKLTYDQLNMLLGQLQVYRLDSQELIWRTAAAQYEKILFTLALLQVGLLITAPLSGGSFIASFCFTHSLHLAKALTASSRLFGIATLAGAIGMRLAMRSYSKWVNWEQEQSVALKKVTESMERVITIVTQKKWNEILRWGLDKIQRNEERLKNMKRENAELAQTFEWIKNELKMLKAENKRKDRQIIDRAGVLENQDINLDDQAGMLNDLRNDNEEKGHQIETLTRAHTEKGRQLTAQAAKLEDQAERLAKLENLLLIPSGLVKRGY